MGMIITRKAGEGIQIGEALVTVVRMRNGRVKIDVRAPSEVVVRPAEKERGDQKTTPNALAYHESNCPGP